MVHGDTLFLVGNLQSPNPEERPVLPTTIVMCQYHFPKQKWTRLKLRGAPEICHYPLLAAHKDQLILFGGEQATALLQLVCMQKRGCSYNAALVDLCPWLQQCTNEQHASAMLKRSKINVKQS